MWSYAVFEKTLFDTRLRNSFVFSNVFLLAMLEKKNLFLKANVAFRNLDSKIQLVSKKNRTNDSEMNVIFPLLFIDLREPDLLILTRFF